ncbi:MAG: hypothetical protein VKO39_07950 [Cyanobacteriota bacterium]|nr:hypothetical protein [Cyanobacteriota bacterium]
MFHAIFRSFLLCGCLALGSAAEARVIFSDNFSAVPSARGLPFISPPGWMIGNNGWVELLGQCPGYNLPDLLPNNDCYIDLDGNSAFDYDADPNNLFPPGLLLTSVYLSSGHIYELQFQLAGNQSTPFGDGVFVNFGEISGFIFVPPFDDFTTFTYYYSPQVSGVYNLSFENTNVDAFGALLDNVVIIQSPAPLPALGAAAAFGFCKKLRKRIRHLPPHR